MTRPVTKTGGIVAIAFWLLFANGARGQGLSELYRITDGAFGSHMEYHPIKIPQGKEVLLAQLQGPGKVTYFYITDDSQGKFYPGLVA